MSYIVMGKDECGSEFRPSNRTWSDIDDAYDELEKLREKFEEARSMWVEVLHDQAYFNKNRDYWDYEDY